MPVGEDTRIGTQPPGWQKLGHCARVLVGPCSQHGVEFTNGTRPLGLVYLYKRGSWYPFAPSGPDRHDSAVELQVRSAVEEDLRMVSDLGRWFPVYGAPGL